MVDKFLLEVKAKLEWEADNQMSKKVRKFNNKPPIVYGDCPFFAKTVTVPGITQKSPIRFGPKR